MASRDDAHIDAFAQRVMSAQDVRMGPLAERHEGLHPIPTRVVAAVLHALADHTHNRHMVDVIVDGQALAHGDTFEPRATSLGRYFHALADSIEWSTIQQNSQETP